MGEGYASGYERYAAVGIAALVAVFQVSSDRAAYRAHLHSDLVFASGEQFDLDEAESIADGYSAVAEPGFLGSCFWRQRGVRFVVAFDSGDIMGQQFGVFGRAVAGERPIGLVNRAVAEHVVESAQGLGSLGEDDETAYRPVKTVDDAEKNVAGLGMGFFDPLLDNVKQGGVAGLIPLDNLAGSFVDYYNMVVFVEYLHKLA